MWGKQCAVSVWSCLIPRCFPRQASKSQTTCVMLSFKNDRGRSTELLLPPAFRVSEKPLVSTARKKYRACAFHTWCLGVFRASLYVMSVVDPSVSLGLCWFWTCLGHPLLCFCVLIHFLLTCHQPNSANSPLNCEREWWWDFVIWTQEPHGAEVGFFFFLNHLIFFHHTRKNYYPIPVVQSKILEHGYRVLSLIDASEKLVAAVAENFCCFQGFLSILKQTAFAFISDF